MGDRYTEERMERYIQKIYKIERDLESIRQIGDREREIEAGSWRVLING